MMTRYIPDPICIYPKDRFHLDPGFDYRVRLQGADLEKFKN